MKGCAPCLLLSITLAGRRLPRGGERKGGGRTPLGLGLHPLLRLGGAEGGARRQTVGEEDASAGATCGDWTCSALSTLSITQIIRSEKRRGRGEAECMMGLMDGCVPGRVGALQYEVPTNVTSAERRRDARATSASPASTSSRNQLSTTLAGHRAVLEAASAASVM